MKYLYPFSFSDLFVFSFTDFYITFFLFVVGSVYLVMINAFCLIALSKYKQFNFNFSECCYLKNKNKTQKQNKRQLQSNIHTEVWPMRGRWWRTQKCLKCHLISKANLRWFYPALPRNRFRGPRDQGVAADVSENVPCPTTRASNLLSCY